MRTLEATDYISENSDVISQCCRAAGTTGCSWAPEGKLKKTGRATNDLEEECSVGEKSRWMEGCSDSAALTVLRDKTSMS